MANVQSDVSVYMRKNCKKKKKEHTFLIMFILFHPQDFFLFGE